MQSSSTEKGPIAPVAKEVSKHMGKFFEKFRQQLGDLGKEIEGLEGKVSEAMQDKTLVSLGNEIIAEKMKPSEERETVDLRNKEIEFKLIVQEIASKLLIDERTAQAQLPEDQRSTKGENIIRNFAKKVTDNVIGELSLPTAEELA